MSSRVVVLASAFVVGLVFSLGAGCSADCRCPAKSALPEAQGPLPDLVVASYDANGNLDTTPVVPEQGSIELAGDSVLIRYTQDSVAHEVIYAVVDAR
jgi:hypothetical protein